MGAGSQGTDAYATSADQLIADANLLLRFLADAGLLTDAALGDAILAMEKARGGPDERVCFAALTLQYSKAVILAKPHVSIADLRSLGSPFELGLSSRSRGSLKQMTTSSLAIVLIFLSVLGFALLQDVTQKITELQRIALLNPLEKLSGLRRLIAEGALNDPKSEYYLQYQKASNEVTLLFDSANAIIGRTSATGSAAGVVPEMFEVLLFEVSGIALSNGTGSASGPLAQSGGIGAAVQSGGTAQSYGLGGVVIPDGAGASGSAGGTASSSTTRASSSPRGSVGGAVLPLHLEKTSSAAPALIDGIYKQVQLIGAADCKPYNTGPVISLYGNGNKAFLDAALDKFDDYCLAQTLDINVGNFRMSGLNNAVRKLQQESFMFGILFLPLVGGLLGSSIFVVYLLMNRSTQAPPSWNYLFVRIMVGGAFGVIIGWFASPTGGSSTDMTEHISGTPFTLAFLAGFSIESLWNVLLKFSTTFQNGKQPP